MRIRVTPNAKKDEVFVRDGVLCVKVSCPPEDGKANRRAIESLENEFGCKVTLISGAKSRDKEVGFGCGSSAVEEKIKRLEAKGKTGK